MEPNSRISRQEKEECIHRLVETYPKAFFIEPRQRVPLKKNIVSDIVSDGFPFVRGVISEAVDWYQSHYGYQKAQQAGVSRVDLHGKRVSTVTETEARAARKKIAEINEQRREVAPPPMTSTPPTTRNGDPARVLRELYAENKISDDMVKKLDAPPLKGEIGRSPNFDEGFLAGYDAGYSAGHEDGYKAGESVAAAEAERDRRKTLALAKAKVEARSVS